MKLVRILAYNCILHHRRVFVKHIKTELNVLADSLSRMNFQHFWSHALVNMQQTPDPIPAEIWPVDKVWFN